MQAVDVHKSYRRGSEIVHAVRGVDFAVGPGEIVAIRGASGSGKTTLLALLCGWEQPDSGVVTHPGGMGWTDLALVPQTLGLLEDLTVGENVLLPARLNHIDDAETDDHGDSLIRRFGLDHLIDRHPAEISLGEQQRAAVARALLLRPALVLADEPTAHQDHGCADVVLSVLREHAAAGTAFVLVSHHAQAWDAADRVTTMADGTLS